MNITHHTTHNQEFRDFAAVNKYPFTDDSAYTATDGRELPLGAFLDIVLYPPDTDLAPIHVHGVRSPGEGELEIGFTRKGVPWATSVFEDPDKDWAPVRAGSMVVGSLVMGLEGMRVLRGLVEYATLFLSPSALVVRPDRILGLPFPSPSLTTGGVERPLSNKSPEIVLAGDRWGRDGDIVSFDNSVKTVFKGEGQPIVFGGNVLCAFLRSPRWSNLTALAGDGGITLHKRGDGYDD